MKKNILIILVLCTTILASNFNDHIQKSVNFPQEGVTCFSTHKLLSNPDAFHEAITQLAAQVAGEEVEVIAGVDARGFVLGAALAFYMKLPFVMVRKAGKTFGRTVRTRGTTHYGATHEFELADDAIGQGKRVLVVDDMIVSGGSVAAIGELIELVGGVVVGAATLIEFSSYGARSRVQFPIYSLIEDDYVGSIRG